MATETSGPTGRMRNYRAMGKDKLLRCIDELGQAGTESYDRAKYEGSGEPGKDREVARQVAHQKGWLG